MQFRPITIAPAANGVILSVGCQTFVFESATNALIEISRFIEDPQRVEKEWAAKCGFVAQEGGGYPVPQQAVASYSSAPRNVGVDSYISPGPLGAPVVSGR